MVYLNGILSKMSAHYYEDIQKGRFRVSHRIIDDYGLAIGSACLIRLSFFSRTFKLSKIVK